MKHLEVEHSYGEENLRNILLNFIYSKLEAYDAGCHVGNCQDCLEHAEDKKLSLHCFKEGI